MPGNRTTFLGGAALGLLVMFTSGCGLDWGRDANACRDAKVGTTQRQTIEEAFGAPDVVIELERDGKALVQEGWLDRGAVLTFDAASGRLTEKECAPHSVRLDT